MERCLASSAAGKPDHCDDRRQWIVVSETLSARRRTRPRVKTVNFIASDSGLRVLAEELGIEGRSDLLRQIIGAPSSKIQLQSNTDIGANVASGSYPSDAMVVIPCSVGTLARIANGIASHLIERAADVTLKERRPLVLCVRETPLNKIHIRNMSLAADAGATIFPLIPTFYNHPSSADAMAQEFANRVLAHIGLPQPDAYRWKGLRPSSQLPVLSQSRVSLRAENKELTWNFLQSRDRTVTKVGIWRACTASAGNPRSWDGWSCFQFLQFGGCACVFGVFGEFRLQFGGSAGSISGSFVDQA